MQKLISKTKEAYLAQKLFYFDKIKPGSENLKLKLHNLNRLVNPMAKYRKQVRGKILKLY